MKCNVDQSLIKVNTASQNATNGTRSKSTERTSKVASDGIMCLAFEVCRGPDGIRCSDDLRNI